MKKVVVFLLIIVICFSLSACGNKIENLIADIETLENEEITLEDECRIDKIYDKYLALSEEDKMKITNYNILETASKRVNYLSAQEDTIRDAPQVVEEYIKSRLKIPSAMQVIKTQVYASKESCYEAFVRMQYTGENAFGGKVEETCFAHVRIMGAGYNDILDSHFGDAHETWDNVGWSDHTMEEIDFES